ncbi:hypothetical protein CWB96_16500 [Pseudoalteromonas citrea]|uniref:VCBS repeat-containing protein n=1 Tax=Pseudoalteromonas citrea TaxID=43655 RepID=A0A5S3XL20_9GAMM|nr:hypothetical protein [Pseudoalteromonas citrea]TMP41232.1 hypothetical protein CWB97_15290 [Pseudoalteromonas citrea]TMP55805.1 hypothetical protein CWB96_16500 [Pseudoalteromonas citrea]
MLKNVLVVILCMLLLMGCGSGSSDDTKSLTVDGSSTDSSVPIISNPTSKIVNAYQEDLSILKDYAEQLANSAYQGETDSLVLEIEEIRGVFKSLYIDLPSGISRINLNSLNLYADANNRINTTKRCDISGEIKALGTVEKYSIRFYNCIMSANNAAFSGTIAIYSDAQSNTSTSFFENLKWQKGTSFQNFNGYITNSILPDSVEISQEYISYESESISLISNSKTVEKKTSLGLSIVHEGELYFAEIGKVLIGSEYLTNNSEGYISGIMKFNADNFAQLVFNENWAYYTQDIDLDEQLDLGRYFDNLQAFLNSNIGAEGLTSIDVLSEPPVFIGRPEVIQNNNKQITTLDLLRANIQPHNILDPDTPFENLTFKYNWYLNGTQVSGYNTKELPAGIAKLNDSVQVSVDVTDLSNTVSSELSEPVTIGRAPFIFTSSHSNQTFNAGESVVFAVGINDPDQVEQLLTIILTSGPEGAEMDALGNVLWQAPNHLLFAQQSYQFTFATYNDLGNKVSTHSVDLDVQTSNSKVIARGGFSDTFNVEYVDIADFDADGKNELLYFDDSQNVSIFDIADDKASYWWSYPYKKLEYGNLNKVSGIEVDADNTPELLLQYDRHLEVLYDLDSIGSAMYTTDNYISLAQIKDLNNDGLNELVILENARFGSGEPFSIFKVLDFSNPKNVLFEDRITSAYSFVFVEHAGAQLPIVMLNNGIAYDSNGWKTLSVPKIGSELNVADLDGDGIDEVVAFPNYREIQIYNFNSEVIETVTFKHTSHLPNAIADIDNDGIYEILRKGSTQRDPIRIYNVTSNNELRLKSEISSDVLRMRYLSLKDINLDGKPEIFYIDHATHRFYNDALKVVTYDLTQSNSTPMQSYTLPRSFNANTAAGWVELGGQDKYAIFAGQNQVTTLSLNGDILTQNNELGSLEGSMSYDYDGDGYGELFLREPKVVRLLDHALIWEDTVNSNYNYIKQKVLIDDINLDGYMEHIFLQNKALIINDIWNNKTLLNESLDYNAWSAHVWTHDNETLTVTSGNYDVNLYKLEQGKLTLLNSIEQKCSKLTTFNHDKDAAKELLCLKNIGDKTEMKVYEIISDELVEKLNRTLDYSVVDYEIDPSFTERQGIFFTTTGTKNANGSYVTLVDNNGQFMWRSISLSQVMSQNSIKARYSEERGLSLQLATEKMLFLIN